MVALRPRVLRLQTGGKRRDFGLGSVRDVGVGDTRERAAEMIRDARHGRESWRV